MKKFSIKVMELIREKEKEKTIYFACIEKANKSSYKVVESAGYHPLGTVKTLGFSRFFPKKRKKNCANNFKRRKSRSTQDLLHKAHYNNHTLTQFDSLFIKDNYFVIREKGEIIAGCQYHRAHWVINNMKGFSGKIVMNVVPLNTCS